ncbi:hypothetical protein ACOMHN_028707 [Nucella lapillus]
MQRPISPHLTVFKPHLSMVSSITFRITGVALQTVVTGVPLCLLALPGDYSHYLDMVKNMAPGPAFIASCKLLLVFPLVFHFFNGIRHLDAGMGFGVKTLYNTGVAVWILTAIFTIYFAVFY